MKNILVIFLIPILCYSQNQESLASKIVEEFNQFEFHNHFFQNFAIQNGYFIYTYGSINSFGTGRVTKVPLKDITSIEITFSTDDNMGGWNDVSGLIYFKIYYESGKAQFKYIGEKVSESVKVYSKDYGSSLTFTFRNSYETHYLYKEYRIGEPLIKLISAYGGNAILK